MLDVFHGSASYDSSLIIERAVNESSYFEMSLINAPACEILQMFLVQSCQLIVDVVVYIVISKNDRSMSNESRWEERGVDATLSLT